MRHLLDIDDLTSAELAQILEWSADPSPPQVLAGRGAALLFEKPSNRTRNATEMAVVHLGGHPVTIRPDEIEIGVREPAEDVVRVLAQYHAVVGARVFDHRLLEAMAGPGVVPVVNLLSDRAHPGQAIADLLALRGCWGCLQGHTVAWIGDGNNVARSLLHACARTGIDVHLASPPGHGLDGLVLDAARSQGISVLATDDPRQAVEGADAVATDTWVSMGQEAETAARRATFGAFRVDAALMAAARPGAVFLHCLPAHRGEEVTSEVIDGPASLVWEQARQRMFAMQGIFRWLLDSGPSGRISTPPGAG